MTETPCVPDPDWLERLLEARGPGVAVIGGAIGAAPQLRAVDRGAYFAEYGIYGATRGVSLPDGTPHIAAANLAYHRSVLAEVVAGCAAGDAELTLHGRLRLTGLNCRLVPAAVVRFDTKVSLAAGLGDRFTHGFGYALARGVGRNWTWRIARALIAPGMAPVLAGRIARVAHPEARTAFVRSLPATLCFLLPWSCGEAAGYLCGGRSRTERTLSAR